MQALGKMFTPLVSSNIKEYYDGLLNISTHSWMAFFLDSAENENTSLQPLSDLGAEDFSAAQLRAGALPLDTEVDGFKKYSREEINVWAEGKVGDVGI